MPLSDHEQQLLSQMEQQLLAEDPKFASTMQGAAKGARAGRRLIIGGTGLVLGLGLLILAAVTQYLLLALPAFLLMLAGVTYALSRPPVRGPVGVVRSDGTTTSSVGGRRRPPAPGGSKGFMNRLEERWERRNGSDGWN